MKDGQMTTVLVHNMIRSSHSHERPASRQKKNIMSVQYQQYSPSTLSSDIHGKIRSRSFYHHKNSLYENERKQEYRRNNQKSIQLQNTAKEPKILDVQFQIFRRQTNKKQKKLENPTAINQYYSLMIDSMQKYISKVERGKKKKQQKFEKTKHFGIDIKSIKYSAAPDATFSKLLSKNSLKQKMNKTISQHKNSISDGQNIAIQSSPNKAPFYRHEHSINNKLSLSEHYQPKKQDMLMTIPVNLKKPKFFSKKVTKTNKQEQKKTTQAKFDRMINFLSILLSSYGTYLIRQRPKDLSETDTTDVVIPKNYKKKQKYSYFIGKGNNKNAIVSLLKKRWWWTQADDMASADFVWTQLKVPTILCKQTSMMYSDVQQARPQAYKRQSNQTEQPSQSLSKLFHNNHSPTFYEKLSEKHKKNLLRSINPPLVLHNHYQANYMLGNKKALFHNLHLYKTYKNQNPFEYMPLTFHVQKIASKNFKAFQKVAKENKKALWIVKPGQNSNRGNGIFVSDSLEKIKTRISKDSKHTYIIQKYLKNNFMFNRRKFDIRVYLLMISIGGVKKFFWYSQGYLRTCSQIYDLSDLDDPFIHLTNDAIQMTGDNYGKYEKGNKVTYHEFQRYLQINYPDQKYSVAALVQKMKQIARQVIQSVYFKLDPCRKESGFELFGMDFIIDSKFKPWLLQVNTNPCLQLSSPVLERLIPRMLQNMFRIALDPMFQPPKGELPRCLAHFIPDNIAQTNRFELIFDCLYDRDIQFQQYCRNNQKQQVYEDEDQEFDNDGEFIKLDQ